MSINWGPRGKEAISIGAIAMEARPAGSRCWSWVGKEIFLVIGLARDLVVTHVTTASGNVLEAQVGGDSCAHPRVLGEKREPGFAMLGRNLYVAHDHVGIGQVLLGDRLKEGPLVQLEACTDPL